MQKPLYVDVKEDSVGRKAKYPWSFRLPLFSNQCFQKVHRKKVLNALRLLP